MFFIKKRSRNLVYILLLILIIIFNKFSTNNLYASTYQIKDVSLNKPYDLNFRKIDVIEKAFKLAFIELVSKITISNNKDKFENIEIEKIRKLIDSFSITEEKFINDRYSAKFEVNFNKKSVQSFMNSRNIFTSIPIEKKIFLLPILLDNNQNEVFLFSENDFYNRWDENKKKHHLLTYVKPNEDLDDINIIKKNLENIEDYNFKNIISKYNLKDYIIAIFFRENKNIKVLSKVNFNHKPSIINHKFDNSVFEETLFVDQIINTLKTSYENEWKKINQINRSIKLALTISLDSKNYNLIQKFEKNLITSDLIAKFYIESISNEYTMYKVIYNGTPDKFLIELNNNGFEIDISNEVWILNE